MAQDQLLLSDGASRLLLSDGVSVLLLSTSSGDVPAVDTPYSFASVLDARHTTPLDARRSTSQ
jgi:hypothetical protein